MSAIYAVPRATAPIDLYLDSNEGARPAAGLLECVDPVNALRRYPDTAPLEGLLANKLGIGADRVLVTAGGDDAIDRLCRVWLDPMAKLVLPMPCFEMVPRYARLTGADIIEVPWATDAFPVEDALAVFDPAVIVITSPNNPTGAVVTVDELRRLSEEAPNALLLVDLAYAEFADDDLTAAALELDNAVVIRTLSKAWGLAGLRVGYALGSPENIARMRAVGPPYAVSGISLSVAIAALGQVSSMTTYVSSVRREREALQSVLSDLGAAPRRSQGNFVFAKVSNPLWIRDALAGLGIAIRAFPGRPGLERAIRVTCPGDQPVFERLEGALRAALAPQALLFDMDGVLVDVSQSYRVAICETAASFGVQVTAADICAAKANGDANNDWILTAELIRRAGVRVSLEEVTAVFEARYQGGLWLRERPLVSAEVLRRLADRLPLGIVTGRPRADAERFLNSEGLTDLFGVVVTMEDAAAKPDPAPVCLALSSLNVERAWMVGDTVDDVRAAKAAGVVPIGFGGALPEAARVLSELAELEGLL